MKTYVKKNKIHLIKAMAVALSLVAMLVVVLPGEARAYPCRIESQTVKCDGVASNDVFIIGSSGTNSVFTICHTAPIVSKLYTFDRALFNHMEINGGNGDDFIQVLLSGSFDCWIGLHKTVINPYGSKWDEYLDASGGAGIDQISGTNNNDYFIGGPGHNFLYGKGGSDTLLGGPDDDFLYAGDGEEDYLDGGSGWDVLHHGGGTGYDYMCGGSGYDYYYSNDDGAEMMEQSYYDDGNYFEGGAGVDTIYGDGGTDTIDGGLGDDIIHGGDGIDWIIGGGGDDTIFGEGGDDCIVGDYFSGDSVGGEGWDQIDAGDGWEDRVYCDNAIYYEGVCDPYDSYEPWPEETFDSAYNCRGEYTGSCDSMPPANCEYYTSQP